MQQQIDPALIAQRQKKHKSIMTMIHSYRRTPEQLRNFEKLKNSTKLQIEMRFKGCKQRQGYKFPVQNISDDDDEEEEFSSTAYIYDLAQQKPIIEKNKSLKQISSRTRVKSLEAEQFSRKERGIIGRIKRDNINLISKTKDFKEVGLLKKQALSAVKLPHLKSLEKSVKKLTAKKNIEQLFGKKMITQGSPDKQVPPYLKNFGLTSKNKPKKFFLQKY